MFDNFSVLDTHNVDDRVAPILIVVLRVLMDDDQIAFGDYTLYGDAILGVFFEPCFEVVDECLFPVRCMGIVLGII